MSDTIQQVGALPYLIKNGRPRFILITPKLVSDIWIAPKGHIETDLGLQGSAEAEALEEAGVIGRADARPIGSYTYRKFNNTYEVSVYPLKVIEVLDTWDEDHVRERCIVKRKRAVELISLEPIAEMITSLAKRLKQE